MSELVFDHFGIQWFVAVLLLSAAIRVVGAHLLPSFKVYKPLHSREGAPAVGIIVLGHRGIQMVLVGSVLISASHGFNNVFSTLHWTNIGISTGVASALWTVSVVAEVGLMWSFKSVAKKHSARKCC